MKKIIFTLMMLAFVAVGTVAADSSDPVVDAILAKVSEITRIEKSDLHSRHEAGVLTIYKDGESYVVRLCGYCEQILIDNL